MWISLKTINGFPSLSTMTTKTPHIEKTSERVSERTNVWGSGKPDRVSFFSDLNSEPENELIQSKIYSHECGCGALCGCVWMALDRT